jgi:hypothetical protein
MFFKKKDKSKLWEQMKREDRKHPRMSIKTLVEVVASRDRFFCKLQDISLTGAAIISPYPLGQGEEVIIRLDPPEDPFRRGPELHPAEAYGEIMHCRPKKEGEYKVGLRFPRQSEAMEAVIRAWFDYFGEDPEKEKEKKKKQK